MKRIFLLVIILIFGRVQASSFKTNHIYQQFKVLRIVLEDYKKNCFRYPNSSEGLSKLYNKPAENCWKGNEVDEKLIKDPFVNNNLKYYFLGNEKTPSYKIISVGIDGKLNTADDWSNLDGKSKQFELRKKYFVFLKKAQIDNQAIVPLNTIILTYSIIAILILIFMFIVRKKKKYQFRDYFEIVFIYFLLVLFLNYIRY